MPISIPHSGDKCSGLCREPCEHEDCWQCENVRVVRAKQRQIDQYVKAVNVLNKERDALKEAAARGATAAIVHPSALAGGVAGVRPKHNVEINPELLEELIKRAGMTIRWSKDGSPEISEPLGAGVLRQASKRIAQNAAATMDKTVSEILAHVEGTEIKRAEGVTDDDVAAADRILKGQPEPEKAQDPLFVDPLLHPDKVQGSFLSQSMLQKVIEELKKPSPYRVMPDWLASPSVDK